MVGARARVRLTEMLRQTAGEAERELVRLPAERLGERDLGELDRRPQSGASETGAPPAPPLADRACLASDDEVDGEHRPVERRDLQLRQ